MPLYPCDHCGKSKPIDAFYPYAKRKCKDCFADYTKKWRAKNPDKVAAIDKRMWARHRDKRLAKRREIGSWRKKKLSPVVLEKMRTYRKAHRMEWNAKAKVRYAVLTGRLVRPKECSACGYKCIPQAHHSDYSKPLEVTWYCASCHKRLHNGTL